MNIPAIKNDERIIFALRELYGKYGYSRYKMNKFEEYDLYVRNKDFLISDNVITFTDTNGKLMALKPDVTLSIVKNSPDIPGALQKVYYNENVYRVSKGSLGFKEIMQTGLECIGDVDDYCIFETLLLAAKSLKSISSSCVLNISHLGIFSDLLQGIDEHNKQTILNCIRDKNTHELESACCAAGLADRVDVLSKLITCYGTPEQVLPELETLIGESAAYKQLSALLGAFRNGEYQDMIRIDFSVVNDVNYYNDIVFKGYIEGVPHSVLSGGQYDRLMRKMGRKSGAIGFAVYLDALGRLDEQSRQFDVDVVLLYDREADLRDLSDAIAALNADGYSVIAQRSIPEKIRFRQLVQYRNREVKILEYHA